MFAVKEVIARSIHLVLIREFASSHGCALIPAALNQPPTSQADPAGLGLNDKRQPELSAVLADPNTVWTRIAIAEPYGGQRSAQTGVSGIAIWRSNGLPPTLNCCAGPRSIR
jgi:hypothetical protein